MPTKSVAIRLPEELVEWLKAKAEREHRTLSNVIVDILLTAKENE